MKELVTLERPADAYAYAATIYAEIWPTIAQRFGTVGRRPLFVPVPSSAIDAAGFAADARWPAREFARALAGKGLGGWLPAFVWDKAHDSKTSGEASRLSAAELHTRLVQRVPVPAGDVVLVDDVMTHGRHFSAMHARIPGARGALVISFTHMTEDPAKDCYTPERRTVTYDQSAGADWAIDTRRAARAQPP